MNTLLGVIYIKQKLLTSKQIRGIASTPTGMCIFKPNGEFQANVFALTYALDEAFTYMPGRHDYIILDNETYYTE